MSAPAASWCDPAVKVRPQVRGSGPTRSPRSLVPAASNQTRTERRRKRTGDAGLVGDVGTVSEEPTVPTSPRPSDGPRERFGDVGT